MMSDRAVSNLPSLPARRFPIGGLSVWLVVYALCGALVYRFSQTGGESSRRACVAALIVCAAGGLVGFAILWRVWHKTLLTVLLGIFLSGAARLLIGIGGVVIIFLFTSIHRTKFVWYLGIFYLAFLVLDSWLGLRLLRQLCPKDNPLYGKRISSIWDLVVGSEPASRSGQSAS